METRTAFVTGASGFIGRKLVKALAERGWKVKVLQHKAPVSERAGFEVVQGDITDYEMLRAALKGTDVVFHLAAALGGALIPKEEFFRINDRGTTLLFEAAKAAGVGRIIHFSSAGVLGHVKENRAVDENHPVHPLDVYDISKLMGETTALSFAGGLDVVVVRPGWVYGPGDRRTFKLVKAVAARRFMLVTRGDARQTPVFIDDLVEGTLLCAEKGKNGEIYHLAGGEVLTVREMVEAIADACGTSIPRIHLPLFPVKAAAWGMGGLFKLFGREAPLTPGRLAFFIHPKPLAIEKARRELGYQPQTDFRTGIHRTIHWSRTHAWL